MIIIITCCVQRGSTATGVEEPLERRLDGRKNKIQREKRNRRVDIRERPRNRWWPIQVQRGLQVRSYAQQLRRTRHHK